MLAGGLLPVKYSSGLPGRDVKSASSSGTGLGEVINRVKMAMLTMQRHAWEQGVAAQALLELGEENLVIMMAREAVLRQWDDGRLGQVCDNHGVTDPGANGEAVLYAGRVLSDGRLLEAARKQAEYFLKTAPRTHDGVIFHLDNKQQLWIDSMYMCPRFWPSWATTVKPFFRLKG